MFISLLAKLNTLFCLILDKKCKWTDLKIQLTSDSLQNSIRIDLTMKIKATIIFFTWSIFFWTWIHMFCKSDYVWLHQILKFWEIIHWNAHTVDFFLSARIFRMFNLLSDWKVWFFFFSVSLSSFYNYQMILIFLLFFLFKLWKKILHVVCS